MVEDAGVAMDGVATPPPPLSHDPVVQLLPTYALRPAEAEKFIAAAAQRVAEKVLAGTLRGKKYDPAKVGEWANGIADEVKNGVRAGQAIPRYKVVVQVTLGEMRDQGVHVASRCLWEPTTDNHAAASFKNVSPSPSLVGEVPDHPTSRMHPHPLNRKASGALPWSLLCTWSKAVARGRFVCVCVRGVA